MTNDELITNVKKNPRWNELELKLGPPAKGALNHEEISILSAVMQIETQNKNEALTQQMIKLTAESVKAAANSALWTKRLAIATFLLALCSALSIIFKR